MPIIKINEENKGLRLDKALANQTEYSRSLLTELIKNDKVFVNSEAKKAKYKVKVGDRIEFEVPEAEVLDIVAEDLPLEIIYEDSDVAVVNKPQGMVVHPAAGHASGTLVNAIMYHIKDLSSINGVIRPGIVHRIDKDTSGLLMIAKNDKAHESLAAQLKDKTSKRRYLAIVHGEIANDKGTIEAPIGRNLKDRKPQDDQCNSYVHESDVYAQFPSVMQSKYSHKIVLKPQNESRLVFRQKLRLVFCDL